MINDYYIAWNILEIIEPWRVTLLRLEAKEDMLASDPAEFRVIHVGCLSDEGSEESAIAQSSKNRRKQKESS